MRIILAHFRQFRSIRGTPVTHIVHTQHRTETTSLQIILFQFVDHIALKITQ